MTIFPLQEAMSLAMRCATRAWEKGASRKAAVRIAASVLTKAAVDRGSKDNVRVAALWVVCVCRGGGCYRRASAKCKEEDNSWGARCMCVCVYR